MTISTAGRSCPLHYRTPPGAFAGAPALRAETLYVAGGVYGNVESLRRVLEMKREEEQRSGSRVELLFNGDFNWFDCDAASFVAINELVLEHRALRGNVEAELDAIDDNGCGCNYPDYIDAAVVKRSNIIMRRLQETAAPFADIRARVAALPMACTVEVGDCRIAVVHGDAESLAGWGFAWEAMPALAGEDDAARSKRGSALGTIENMFRRTPEVAAFASTHTGLPVLQDFIIDGARRLIINNGAAGLPNFKGTRYGLLTRISSRAEPPPGRLYGTTLKGLRFDALPIHYDAPAWQRRFFVLWPPGSPAHDGYAERIARGPQFTVEQALRLSPSAAS